MAHVRTQIRDAFVTALTGLSVTGNNVFKSRNTVIQASEVPCILVYTAETENSKPISMGNSNRPIERVVPVNVQAVHKTLDDLDDIMDTICTDIEKAICGSNDIAALVREVFLESTLLSQDFVKDQNVDKPVGVAHLSFSVKYVTKENDPETAL